VIAGIILKEKAMPLRHGLFAFGTLHYALFVLAK